VTSVGGVDLPPLIGSLTVETESISFESSEPLVFALRPVKLMRYIRPSGSPPSGSLQLTQSSETTPEFAGYLIIGIEHLGQFSLVRLYVEGKQSICRHVETRCTHPFNKYLLMLLGTSRILLIARYYWEDS